MYHRKRSMASRTVRLSLNQIRQMVHAEATARLGMSGEEFFELRKRRELPDTLAAHDISIIASLLDSNGSNGTGAQEGARSAVS